MHSPWRWLPAGTAEPGQVGGPEQELDSPGTAAGARGGSAGGGKAGQQPGFAALSPGRTHLDTSSSIEGKEVCFLANIVD